MTTDFIILRSHSAFTKKMADLGIELVNKTYKVPAKVFIENFPGSQKKISYLCEICQNAFNITVSDWTSKKIKGICGTCAKKIIYVGKKSSQYGKSYNKGIKKTEEHKRKLRGKRTSMEGDKNPNWKEKTPIFHKYRNRVYVLTEKTYSENIDILNPERYPRTLCGVNDGWQLDHIKSIKKCFEEGLTPEEAASLLNLQMLPWKENLLKSSF